MYDSNNPYASPGAEMHPVAAQWLGTPSPSLRRVANGLGLIFAGNILSMTALFGLISGGAAFAGDAATWAAIANVLSIAMLVSFGLNVAGSLFCLATPAESGAQ